MTSDLFLLLAGALVALQLVSLALKRELRDEALYAALLVADLAVLVFVHATARYESMLAFVGESVAVVLVFAPRVLDGMERRALGTERLVRALRVAKLRELVVPGRAAWRRRRQLEDLVDVRSGRSEQAFERLRGEIAKAEDPARAAALHEEFAIALFIDQRFEAGVQHFEKQLGFEYAARRPRFAAYLLRAYGELGELTKAAQMMSLIEEGPAARDPLFAGALLEARLLFCAYAGARPSLEALLAGPAAGLPPRGQQFLREAARKRAEGAAPAPADVTALAESVARRATRPEPRARNRAPVTNALVLVNCAALTAVTVIWRGSILFNDAHGPALVRAGGLFRPAVLAGEWWRGGSAMFLHGGWLHLIMNMYGLLLLGRFVEDVFGGARYFLVYLLSGICGVLASTKFGEGPLSVGASGAIMGLLGALMVTLALRKGSWPEPWRRTLLVNLLLLSALQIYIGHAVPMIDNAAHVGGLVGGAAAALVLMPGGLVGDKPAARASMRALAIAGATLLAVCAVQVMRTPLSRTLARVPWRTVELGGVKLDLPADWTLDVEHARAEDPSLEVRATPRLADGAAVIDFDPPDEPMLGYLYDRARASARRAAP